ncbi:hypothetical protein BGZ95_002609 [Linnemannia exigua]|uniref:Uncharacterized protein n=1 Tax=Linnemannia exigua TaxID=604196 RepID=A0AAD4DIE4_9FUNG|nr:hypothetical protein BGZ95_002609 [Linnemannia exigua]
MSTAASIRSLVSSVKKPRSHLESVENLTLPDLLSSRDSRLQIRTNTALPPMHPKEPFSSLGPPLSTPHSETKKTPASIFRRAIKRHTGADILLPGEARHPEYNVVFQPKKRWPVNGFKGQPLLLPRKGIPQTHCQVDQVYMHPMSASTPCITNSASVMQATVSSSDSGRHTPTFTRIRYAAESASNLSLHEAAQVFAVNAHAEISVHPTTVIVPTIPLGGAVVVASPSVDMSPNEQTRSFVPTSAGSLSTTWTSSFSHGAGPYGKENVSFFEPFQVHAKSRSGQSSNYISFHFDLSHLENGEHNEEYDADSTTHAAIDRASNTSTMSLPEMLSSFLPFSGSTSSLPLRSTQTHMPKESCLGNRASAQLGGKWNWRWWRNGKSLNTDNGARHQEVYQST